MKTPSCSTPPPLQPHATPPPLPYHSGGEAFELELPAGATGLQVKERISALDARLEVGRQSVVSNGRAVADGEVVELAPGARLNVVLKPAEPAAQRGDPPAAAAPAAAAAAPPQPAAKPRFTIMLAKMAPAAAVGAPAVSMPIEVDADEAIGDIRARAFTTRGIADDGKVDWLFAGKKLVR